MTAAPARIRRAIRYAQLENQSRPDVRETGQHRVRMTCSDRLRQPNGQNWSETVGMSPSGRFRVVEERTAGKSALVSRRGIRWDLARGVLIIVSCLMAIVLLAVTASIGTSSIRIRKLDEKIEMSRENNAALQAQLDSSAGDVSVCTEAVRLNLVSSQGAKAILLSAPTYADRTPATEAVPESEEDSGVMAAASN